MEQRSKEVQLHTSGNKVKGIIKYNIRSQLINNSFYEIISQNALKYNTVKALWNHDTNIVLGSTKSNTLNLEDTREGLKFEISMPESRTDILENIKRGDVDGTSFGMNVLEDSWNYDEEYPVRTVLKAELLEISPTPFPAYEDNKVSTRALENAKNKNKSEVKSMSEKLEKILEMLNNNTDIEVVKEEINKLLNDDNEDGEKINKEQLRSLMKRIEKEEQTRGELRGSTLNAEILEKNNKNTEVRTVFRNIIARKPINEIEKRAIGASVAENGGYLLGEEFHNKIIEMKRSLVDLSKYCNVMPVGSKSGIVPIEVSEDMIPMSVVGEFDKNKDGQEPKFKQVKYDVKDMREVYTLSNSFVKDQQVDIMGYLSRKIAKKDVFTTNYYILNGFNGDDGLVTNASLKKETLTEPITLTKIQNIINSFDPDIRAGLKIIVNNDGYSLLSGITYTDGRLVMQENATLASGYQFLGKEIIEISSKLLKNNDTGDKTTIIITNLEEGVTVFDRQAYEVKSSEEAGFDTDSTKVRVIVRKDIKQIDTEAIKIVECPIA
ncbi:phage major capsid protein [Clostridium sporogenes]|uniref:phage major capsid protein n=1 Tax=Clostridium sporogenes TaxID=1509 RepID=UPI00024BA9E8|nr:phage major capsid protein [Clostridium sporogenes]EHN13123.1 phage major capsid protein (HK97 family) [Clostridium sporogenes PA 3679]MCW6106838.1 phage major capsid protein [Clostridium sporogenes]MDU4597892.1 phage major capsid protein [Clostridium sporogenes]